MQMNSLFLPPPEQEVFWRRQLLPYSDEESKQMQ
jgi:hypothetical protein